MDARTIYLDGRFQRADRALRASLTPGIKDRAGVFETMRVNSDSKVLFLDKHLARLRRGLRFYQLRLVLKLNDVRSLIDELLRRNNLKEAGVRLSVWREGKQTRIALVARTLGRVPSSGLKVKLSRQRFIKTKASGIKSLTYSFFRKAFEQAHAQGADEAVLLNVAGKVVEGSRSNIFIVSGGKIITPPLSTGCLDGITRRTVIYIARILQLSCVSRAYSAQDLFSAEEVFLTNALRGIVPVVSIDGRKIGSGKVGPVTQRIAAAYAKITAKE